MSVNHKSFPEFRKSPTGILGLDEVTSGGLPSGRPTLVAGNAGCGKTLLGMEFLVKGITLYDEPGVFVTFEERIEDLEQNVASLGYDLPKLIKGKKLRIDYIQVERSEIEETGEYDLEGLFIRLNYAIDAIGAKRIVLDTIETLFSGFENTSILRAELRRLFQWLKDKGITAIITGERDDSSLTRHGLEEYVSDCVILLDNRVEDQISTRRLRVVKYRGSTHGTNEYPFLIDEDGITVMPITSLRLEYEVSSKRLSSGIKSLDKMLGGGFYKGSNILLTGTAGTGKTSLAAFLADAACKRGEKCLYLAFEESPLQLMRNMSSIGIDLEKHVKKGLLQFMASRSSSLGLETHLAKLYKAVRQFKPDVVIVDPITNLITIGSASEVRSMLGRMMDMLKSENITAMFTSLTQGGENLEKTEYGVSSFVDTWMLLRDFETNGERNRLINVLKSRGTAHSNQVREFVMSNDGIELVDVYLSADGMLTGSARIAHEASNKASETKRQAKIRNSQRGSERRRQLLQAQIASLQAELLGEKQEAEQDVETEKEFEDTNTSDVALMRHARERSFKTKQSDTK